MLLDPLVIDDLAVLWFAVDDWLLDHDEASAARWVDALDMEFELL
jgi:hypothetical protein